jgi:hypothetical protein
MSILALTSNTLIVTPASGNLEYNGQFFGTDSAGSRAQLQRIVRGTAVASTSGTSIDFTGIPAWVERITFIFQGVSTNGSSDYQIRIGTGTVTTSGYAAVNVGTASTAVGTSSYTTGFVFVVPGGASASHSGSVRIHNITGNSWVSDGNVAATDTTRGNLSAGSITLAGVLDIVRITTVNGTDVFDAGTVNIIYEG